MGSGTAQRFSGEIAEDSFLIDIGATGDTHISSLSKVYGVVFSPIAVWGTASLGTSVNLSYTIDGRTITFNTGENIGSARLDCVAYGRL